MQSIRIALMSAVTGGLVLAQTPDATLPGPHFEVAAVKSMPPGGRGGRPTGGPGASQFSWPGVALINLIARAYMINSDQVKAPDWVNSEMYSVDAKIPAGATAEQFATMLQNLLAERFRMTVHHETKMIDGYDLVVAKGGPKLKESVESDGGGGGQFGPDGATMTFNKAPISMLATNLMFRLRGGDGDLSPRNSEPGSRAIVRVIDKTGLTGLYDIKLHYIPAGNETPGDDIFRAVESQLGLKLIPTKVSLDTVVVDHTEKVPTEN